MIQTQAFLQIQAQATCNFEPRVCVCVCVCVRVHARMCVCGVCVQETYRDWTETSPTCKIGILRIKINLGGKTLNCHLKRTKSHITGKPTLETRPNSH